VSVTAKAAWFIESHLSDELSLETMADGVRVSKFHLCRACTASAGGSLAGYVRARRLSATARILAHGAPDILAVALDAGYGSHEAFTRAFRQ
jgi:AraC family transcriptional regulator